MKEYCPIVGSGYGVEDQRESVWQRLEVGEIVKRRAPSPICLVLRPKVRLVSAVEIHLNALDEGGELPRALIRSAKIDHGTHPVIMERSPPIGIDLFQPLRAHKHARG